MVLLSESHNLKRNTGLAQVVVSERWVYEKTFDVGCSGRERRLTVTASNVNHMQIVRTYP